MKDSPSHPIPRLFSTRPMNPADELEDLYAVIRELAENRTLFGLRYGSSGWHALWRILNARAERLNAQGVDAPPTTTPALEAQEQRVCTIQIALPDQHELAVGAAGPTWNQFLRDLIEWAEPDPETLPHTQVCSLHPELPWPHYGCQGGHGIRPPHRPADGQSPPHEIHLVIKLKNSAGSESL